MSLEDKVIIEVGINENKLKSVNPHIPYSPDEIAAEARRCMDAGASVIHYHARDDNSPIGLSSDPALNIEIQRAVTEGTSLLAYPTYGDIVTSVDGHYEFCSPAEKRFGHIVEMVKQDVRMEIGPIDLGAFYDVNAARTEVSMPGQIVPGWHLVRGHQINNGYDHVWLTQFCEQHGLQKTFAAPDTMSLLNLRNLIDMGLVPEEKISLKLFFFGGAALATRLNGMLNLTKELFTDKQVRWMPVVQEADGFPVAAVALGQGADVRTGLGDYAYAKEGLPTNAELVERMVKLASAFGREPASPEETRQIKGLKQLSEKNSVLVG